MKLFDLDDLLEYLNLKNLRIFFSMKKIQQIIIFSNDYNYYLKKMNWKPNFK